MWYIAVRSLLLCQRGAPLLSGSLPLPFMTFLHKACLVVSPWCASVAISADLAARRAGRVHAVCGLAGRPLQPQVPHLRGHAAVGLLLGGLWPVAQLHAGAPARPPVPHLLTPPAVPRAAQGACPPAAPTPCAVLKPCLWQARLSRAASAPRGRRQRRPVSARSRPAPSKPRPGAPASRGPARRRRR